MPYIAPEVIAEAKRIDLLTYLQNREPQELVRLGGGVYCTKEHDSLKISNGKWMWWSHGVGGRSALDYLVKVKGLSFVQAVETIMGSGVSIPTASYTVKEESTPKVFTLPKKSPHTGVAFRYLYNRGIDRDIINSCIKNGLIYVSLPYYSVVFVGKDEDNHKPRYAAFRSTGEYRLMGEVSGSDKHYSFRLEGSNKDEVHLFECAIDALSYATLIKLNGGDWTRENLVSLAGVYAPKEKAADSKTPAAVMGFLKRNPEIKRIFLHLDNDEVGRKATEMLRIQLSDKYEVVDDPPPYGKDFNDFLCAEVNIKKQKERSYER